MAMNAPARVAAVLAAIFCVSSVQHAAAFSQTIGAVLPKRARPLRCAAPSMQGTGGADNRRKFLVGATATAFAVAGELVGSHSAWAAPVRCPYAEIRLSAPILQSYWAGTEVRVRTAIH